MQVDGDLGSVERFTPPRGVLLLEPRFVPRSAPASPPAAAGPGASATSGAAGSAAAPQEGGLRSEDDGWLVCQAFDRCAGLEAQVT